MQIKTTKDKLLMILKKNKAITIDQIMQIITISEPAVRKHLHELEKQGLLIKKSNKQNIGRPFYTYELSKKGHGIFPNQYEGMPVELLKDLEELQGPDSVKALLYKRMEREESNLLAELDGIDFEQKVEKLVELQNKAGYMLEVMKTPEGDYVLTNFNCPIANIAHHFRQVCSNEKVMYNHVFEESEVLPESLITSGAHVCKWIIKAPLKDD